MRQRLDALNALNRADSVLTATERDEAQALADYFDSHGTSNDQMLAHYLLGRCYADMREAPMALHCYQEAISRADTLSPDCDFAQLSRVYGQSATIFYQQGLYRNSLDYYDSSVDYGYQGKDTLNALRSYAMKAAAYDQLQMKDSAILIYEDAIKQLKAYNYNKVAAGFAGLLAFELLKKGEINNVRTLIEEYERHSGYFSSIGEIENGREIFYYWKGLYYLKKNQLDSADYYFRKELRTGKDFNNQNAASYGLAQLFRLKHQSDSADKYSAYSYAMNDSVYAQRATHEVEQAKAMYDYSRQQEIAQQEKNNTEKKQRIIWYLVIGTVFVAFYMLYRYYKKLEEQKRLFDEFVSMQAEVMQLRERKTNYDVLLHEKELQAETMGAEIEELKAEKHRFDRLLKEKEDKIEEQKAALGRYRQLARSERDSVKRQLDDAPIYRQVSTKAARGEELNEKDWKELEHFVISRYPEFYLFVSSREHALTTNMYHVCILVRLQIPFASIANMMGVTAPAISKTCTVILKKLFDREGSGKELGQALTRFN
jgi:tetratricopeptide (TPR) repeat protein